MATKPPTQDDERRDAVLRRMLTTPKAPPKVKEKGDGLKPAAPKQPKKRASGKVTSS